MKQKADVFQKEDFDELLKELGKECRKKVKTNPVELIVVGGASVVFNYGFRNCSVDIDSLYCGVSDDLMKEMIYNVADKNNISTDWLNNDFKNTASFSPKIIQYSEPYKSFSNGALQIRTVKDEYLIAMKLQSDRNYKHDLSDILGILLEKPDLTLEKIDQAILNLYGSNTHTNKNKYDFVKTFFEKTNDSVEIRNKVISKEDENLEIALKTQSEKDVSEISLSDVLDEKISNEEYKRYENDDIE